MLLRDTDRGHRSLHAAAHERPLLLPAGCTSSRAARSTRPTATVTTGYVIAAIRECYEEAGVLLATDANGAMVTDGHPALAHRQAVYDGDVDLRASVRATPPAALRSTISCGSATGSRRSVNRRAASTPASSWLSLRPSQASQHDDNETIASAWMQPEDALGRHERRRADDDAADDQEPRVRREPTRRRVGDGSGAGHWPAPQRSIPKLRRDADGQDSRRLAARRRRLRDLD